MDYCLLEDAFKTESIGCKDNTGTESARKHERKKMKKNREYFKSIDPSFAPTATDSLKTGGANSNYPAAKDYSEAFQNIDVKVPMIPKESEDKKLPSYFLGYDEDSNIEGFTSDFSKSDEKGFEKASSTNLPIPSIDDLWKPLTLANSTTSFLNELPTPGGTYPIWNALKAKPREVKDELEKKDSSSNTVLQKKIDDLIRRLDELEKKSKPTNQEEILAFVGTGIFVIFSLSLLKC
jgi:hypothetical protein